MSILGSTSAQLHPRLQPGSQDPHEVLQDDYLQVMFKQGGVF